MQPTQGKAAELPGLRGSAKQIAWAEQLRAAALTELDERLAPYAADVAGPFRDIVLDAARRHDEAAWWIDRRYGGGLHGLLQELNDDERERVRALQRLDRERASEGEDHG